MSPSSSDHSAHVDARVRALVHHGALTIKSLAEACAMSKTEALEWWSGRRPGGLRAIELTRFCRFFALSENILHSDGELPIDVIRRRARLDRDVLPARYAENAYGFTRGVLHVVEFLNLYCGRPRLEQLLAEMHVHPAYFDVPDRALNLRFTLDLFRRLPDLGLDDEAITGLGRFVSLRNQDTAIGALFVDAQDLAQSYAVLSRHIVRFDQNFTYTFTGTRRELIIEIQPSHALEFLREYSTEEVSRYFRYLRKVFSWFPTLSGLSPVDLKERACVSRGHAVSRYHIDLKRPTEGTPDLRHILGGLSD